MYYLGGRQLLWNWGRAHHRVNGATSLISTSCFEPGEDFSSLKTEYINPTSYSPPLQMRFVQISKDRWSAHSESCHWSFQLGIPNLEIRDHHHIRQFVPMLFTEISSYANSPLSLNMDGPNDHKSRYTSERLVQLAGSQFSAPSTPASAFLLDWVLALLYTNRVNSYLRKFA
ncbi:hypothetical protein DL96DRAFT_1681935 [Flagelloscypha sp. PMI_526]|nr:hypothetical protein DL96DRAFT_1681935 [Flagelloscypha sp. PMI_526]